MPRSRHTPQSVMIEEASLLRWVVIRLWDFAIFVGVFAFHSRGDGDERFNAE